MAKLPSFALLVAGKKADKKPPLPFMKPSAEDHASDLGLDKPVDGKKSDMARSAIEDLMTALRSSNAKAFESAFDDYLEIKYPQLADMSKDEGSPEEEAEETPEEEAEEQATGTE